MTAQAARGERSGTGLGVADAAALGVVMFGLSAGWATQLLVVPPLTRMLADFGGTLPVLTRAAITPVLSLALTTVAVACFGVAIVLRLRRPSRAGLAAHVVAGALALAHPVTLVLAGYLPIFTLAETLR